MPKLRKNRRIETRWGVKYYAALRDAVFVTQASPYVPAEPPLSFRDHASACETLYVCAQCKDCFHFQSSLDDHRARKSWILGYWCQQCFMTVCTHSSEGSMCSDCIQFDRDKRYYLRTRGMHKNQKYGAVRVFYNQCQFFAHLKAHSVTYVHIGDLMLMPIPTNMNHDWGPEIDVMCEALMEYTFLLKVHIIDWLKQINVDHNWWQLVANEGEDKDKLITHIVKGYKGRHYFKPLDIPMEEQFSTLNSTLNSNNVRSNETNSSIELNDKDSPFTDTTTSLSDESVIENEDNPCTINDITFVDCGPASTNFEPEPPINTTKKYRKVFFKSSRDTPFTLKAINLSTSNSERSNVPNLSNISSNVVMSYGNTMITPKVDAKDSVKNPSETYGSNRSVLINKAITQSSNIIKAEKKPSKMVLENSLNAEPASKMQSNIACVVKTNACKNKSEKSKQNMHTLTINSGQKIFTLQSAKHININTIINQLSPQIINNKKIFLLGQNSNPVSLHTKQELSPKKVIQLIPDLSSGKETKTLQTKVVQKLNESSNKNSNQTTVKNKIEPVKSISRHLSDKIVYKNGRKYIIKRSSDSNDNSKKAFNPVPAKEAEPKSVSNIPPLIPISSTDLENIQERVTSYQDDVTPLTPSPSPSELSSSSSSDVQLKQSSSTKGAQKIDAFRLNLKRSEANASTANPNDLFESLSFHKGEDENLYLDIKFYSQKPIYTIVDTSAMITKCKHEMLNEFFHLSYSELKKRHEHLEQVNNDILKVMDFVADHVVEENLKAVNILKHVLKHCIDKCSEKVDDTDGRDTPLHDWESERDNTEENSVCKSCDKVVKPKSYIPGFSKSPKTDVYCSCYRHVCHKCDTYQGNSTRFVAHQTFHDKQKPYLCPDCYRKFETFKSLEIHTWTSCFHTLKRRFLGCKICEINGFHDMESIARHFAIMHSHNRVACENCRLVLPSYSEYKKHHAEKHSDVSEQLPIRLVLCKLGRCIVRCEEYMLHMEKHLVVQRLIWFKCPFCTVVNIEAKRILSHLQTEHLSLLKEIVSPDVLWCVLPEDMAVKSQNKFVNAHTEPCKDGTVVPKIINTRTITSELFERGAQETDDYLANADTASCPKAVRANCKPSLSNKTPKILEVRSIASLTLDGPKREISRTNVTEDTESRRATEENKVAKETGSSRNVAKENKTTVGVKYFFDSASDDEAIKRRCSDKSDKADGQRRMYCGSKSSDGSKNKSFENKKTKAKTMEAKETNGVSSNVQSQKQAESVRQTPISKPPPLARIPQHIVELSRSNRTVQTIKGGRTTVLLRDRGTSQSAIQRIALNGPKNSKEMILNFSCHLCGELISTSQPVINDHFQNKHSQDCKLSVITSRLLRLSSEFINGGYKDVLGIRKRKIDNSSSGSKRRRRWTPKKYSDGKSANFPGLGLCVTQETAEDSEGKFRCKKCDQRCSNMSNLREHIASEHRIRGRYLICLECGENFVVAPSLQMHLKAFHGIEDPITYMAQNTSYAPDSIDDFEIEAKAIEANQCHVCMAVFENKAAVDKHLRVHGMAFLNRKRIEAQNALKSPEKKNEGEDEKQESESVKLISKQPARRDKPAETILEKITATI